jgi:hypothetical protein
LSKSLSAHAHAVSDLKQQPSYAPPHGWQEQLNDLRASIEALTREVEEVKRLIETLVGAERMAQAGSLPAAHVRFLSVS